MMARSNSGGGAQAGASDRLFLRLSFVLLCFLFVLPHSNQVLCGLALAATAAFALVHLVQKRGLDGVGIWPLLAISIAVHLFYIAVGQARGAPAQAAQETFAVFVVAPILWMLVLSAMRTTYSPLQVYRLVEAISVLASISVGLFFLLFFTVGPNAVQFMIATPNIAIREGTITATMHVYATLIFMTSAMLSFPDIHRKGLKGFVVPFLLIIVALTSGRTALLLSGAIGLTLGVVMRGFIGDGSGRSSAGSTIVGRAGYLLVGGVALILLADLLLEDLDLAAVFESVMRKVLSGGGTERKYQIEGFLRGIARNDGLGAGHGMGISYVRDVEKPWRYEVFLLASIYRLGFIGFILASLPFIYYAFSVMRAMVQRNLSAFDIFLFAGWVSLVVGSLSNPYPESFIYQGLLLLPAVLFDYGKLSRSARQVGHPVRAVPAE